MTKNEAIEYIVFLDELRQSRRTNMFGAAPYIVEEFKIPIADARKILSRWMGIGLTLPMDQRAKAMGGVERD